MVKKFYVCLYGGGGSKMLYKALEKYGATYHIHSRVLPDKLEYIEIYHTHYKLIAILI